MATKKYMLMRKSLKGNWKPIWTECDDGERRKGGKNSSRDKVQAQRDSIAQDWPSREYAVLEVMED